MTPDLVSILITSYNYENYVGATIDSALDQTYPAVEVIVVDDGSTDGSWKVIEGYGSRIRSVRNGNGGQGSAYNTAMAMSRGRYVLFLDSDDLLDPQCVEACVAALAAPGAAKAQFRLRLIDADGSPLGGAIPYLMHCGDVRPLVRDFGLYAGPPGSGNLYRRSAIEDCFPLQAETWRRGGADSMPYVACAFHGEVVSIRQELGSYRLHTAANSVLGLFGNTGKSFHETLGREEEAALHLRRFVESTHALRLRDPLLPTPTQLRVRCLSWKFEPGHHPYPGDTGWSLLRTFGRVLASWPGYGRAERWLLWLWLALILALPRGLTGPLARSNSRGRAKATIRRWTTLLA